MQPDLLIKLEKSVPEVELPMSFDCHICGSGGNYASDCMGNLTAMQDMYPALALTAAFVPSPAGRGAPWLPRAPCQSGDADVGQASWELERAEHALCAVSGPGAQSPASQPRDLDPQLPWPACTCCKLQQGQAAAAVRFGHGNDYHCIYEPL